MNPKTGRWRSYRQRPATPIFPHTLEPAMTEPTTAADRLFALIASIPGSGSVDWCDQARALLAEHAVSSAGVVQLPPTNQAALRQRVAKALWDANGPAAAEDTNVDAVLSVLPAPVDRAAVLLEAADALGRMDYDTDSNDYGYDTYRDAWNGGVMDGAEELRRMAAEAPATEEQDEAWDLPDARPGTTDHTLTQRSAVVQPARPHNDETPDSDPIETSTEAALGQAKERLRQVLGVAEVIEANGIGWAADSVRRAAKGEPS